MVHTQVFRTPESTKWLKHQAIPDMKSVQDREDYLISSQPGHLIKCIQMLSVLEHAYGVLHQVYSLRIPAQRRPS